MRPESGSYACVAELRRCASSVHSSSSNSRSEPLQTSKTRTAVPAHHLRYVARFTHREWTRLMLDIAQGEASENQARQTSTRLPPRPARGCVRPFAWQRITSGIFRRLSQRPIGLQPIQRCCSGSIPLLASERDVSPETTTQRL